MANKAICISNEKQHVRIAQLITTITPDLITVIVNNEPGNDQQQDSLDVTIRRKQARAGESSNDLQTKTLVHNAHIQWHHHHHHQFLTPAIWRRWVRINYLHCPQSLLKSIAPISVSQVTSHTYAHTCKTHIHMQYTHM